MKTASIIATLAAATALALPGVGGAQIPSGAADAPVMWGGDRVEYRPDGFSLIGRAEFTQGANRLRANRVDFHTNGDGDLTRVQAAGQVYYVTPRETMRGDNAVYTVASDDVVVTGDVILTQGENVVTGGRVVYNVRTETARMEGGANGRVRGVFYPNRN